MLALGRRVSRPMHVAAAADVARLQGDLDAIRAAFPELAGYEDTAPPSSPPALDCFPR